MNVAREGGTRSIVLSARAQWERMLGWALATAGALALLGGFHSMARTRYSFEQVAFLISGGFGGLVLLTAALGLLLIADLRDEEHKAGGVERLLGSTVPVAGGRRATRLAVVALLAAGAVLVVVAWRIAARTADLDTALEGAVVGAVGVMATVGGVAGATVGTRSRLRRKLRHLDELVHQFVGEPAVESGPPARLSPDGAITDTAWTVPNLRRFHRQGCPALVHAEGERFTVSPAATQLEPCRLCWPDPSV